MSNGPPSTTYSESNLTNTTPVDFNSPADQTHEMSKAAINELIAQQNQPLWKAFGDAQAASMKERAEMKLRIDVLEASEQDLKNQVENFDLNNAQLVDRVEKMETENAQLKRMLNEMEISGQIKQLKQQHDSEREEWKSEKQEMEEKMEALELNLKNKIRKRQDLGELIMMRTELGEIGGAGHFFGNDKKIVHGGVRDDMSEKEVRKVLRLLSLGEKKINLKFGWGHNWEVAEAGWTIQFKSAYKNSGGDGKYYYLWISHKGNFNFF
ncbi:unnamed protein product [Oikopleura dioica]|uniref:Uncharacterized protein n=1 Tax=Oikopleura dioica TaxID=34765 RepID=E4XNH8_OIKDI|nr:unnamed protein product [Oikopleura dioica]CBY32051.1 unnamed protein product [Oikopleura dioica]